MIILTMRTHGQQHEKMDIYCALNCARTQ